MRIQRDALQTRLKETEGEAQAAQKNADLQRASVMRSKARWVHKRESPTGGNECQSCGKRTRRDGSRAKKEEEEAQEKKAQLIQHGSNLAELPDSAPDTKSQEVRKDAQPAHEAMLNSRKRSHQIRVTMQSPRP